MSKVYSFRLDENNHREAQAREVINAWISKGYSLRHLIINALISYQSEDSHNSALEEVLGKIINLLEALNKDGEPVKDVQGTLPEAFVGSISKSVKSGMKIM